MRKNPFLLVIITFYFLSLSSLIYFIFLHVYHGRCFVTLEILSKLFTDEFIMWQTVMKIYLVPYKYLSHPHDLFLLLQPNCGHTSSAEGLTLQQHYADILHTNISCSQHFPSTLKPFKLIQNANEHTSLNECIILKNTMPRHRNETLYAQFFGGDLHFIHKSTYS